jgi:Domain of unknown function (DUF5668)
VNGRAHLVAQAVRGPILLVTLGFLFALHQAGVVSFARTWPLILIVMGVMKLIERMVTPPVPPYMPPPPPYTPPFGPPPPPPGGPVL